MVKGFLVVTWSDIERLTLKVAQQLVNSNFIPNSLVGVLRGGWIVARLLGDYVGINEVGGLGIKFYRGVGDHFERPVITEPLTLNLKDKTVLIVDDVADSGRTLQLAVEFVKLYGPKEVRTATLYVKPKSITVPDFYAAETDLWIVFPWEPAEVLRNVADLRGVRYVEEELRKVANDIGLANDEFTNDLIKLISRVGRRYVT